MQASSAIPGRPEPLVIRPSSRWPSFGLRELWRYRELLYFLALRDLKVRYKQTLLGVAWAVVQPILYMIVFTLFFAKVAKLYTPGQAYAPLTLTGSVIWLFFANSVSLASNSLVGSAALITKVYFPRLLAAASPVIAALVDLLLATAVTLGIIAAYGYYPTWRMVMALPFVGLALTAAIGTGAWLAALNVKYRDVRYVVPFLLQLWMFASAVFYSFTALGVHGPWKSIFWLNPMAGAVEGFRWSLLAGVRPSVVNVLFSAAGALTLLIVGVVHFRRTERFFADIV
jgi:lipopolysaccharide transport system permease protein